MQALPNIAFSLPESFKIRHHITPFAAVQHCVKIMPPANHPIKQVFFALHGGGFYFPPAVVHFKFYYRLATTLSACVIIPLYPRLPKATALTCMRMIKMAYGAAVNFATIHNCSISVLGDSSGGALTLLLVQSLKSRHKPQPRLCVLISPWLDLTLSDPKIALLQPHDHFLSVKKLLSYATQFAGSLKPDDPKLSPIYGDLTQLAPLLVFGGHHDILMADVWQLIKKATAQNADITVWHAASAQHDFVLYNTPLAQKAKKVLFNQLAI